MAQSPLISKRTTLVCASVSTLLIAVALHASQAHAQSSDAAAPAAAAPAAPAAAAPAAAAPAAAAPAAAAPAAASAGNSAGTQQLQNVTVTGSAISSPNAATAVPVTVYQASQLREQGITTANQFLQQLGVNNSSYGSSFQSQSGSYTGGASYANMRGLGTDKTLVLLNGKRLINNVVDGGSVDLTSIPFAAVKRIEVLRDGASALYGSDAVAGVINFITDSNYQGAEIHTHQATPTKSGGGQNAQYDGTWGFGDINKDGFNWMGSLSYNRQNELPQSARHYHRGEHPYYGTLYQPGVYNQGGKYYQTGCYGTQSRWDGVCTADGRNWGDLISHEEDTDLFTALNFKEGGNNKGQLSYFWHHQHVNIRPYPDLYQGEIDPKNPNYPANAPDPTQPVYTYSAWPSAGTDKMGMRDDVKRIMFDQSGSFGGWTYDTSVAYNRSTSTWRANEGYLDGNKVASQFEDGSLNPLAPLTPEGQRLLDGDHWSGKTQRAWGSLYDWNGHIGHSLGDWFGAGPVQLAVGAEASHERFSTTDYDNPVQSSGISASHVAAHRDQQALWTEVNVPVLESLELDGSVRYDRYSSVGHTTNPKISFRYQPLSNLTFRGDWSSAFVAPTLYDIASPQSITYSSSGLYDPALCPGGKGTGQYCSAQFRSLQGGNPKLKPEKSNQWNFGVVYEPVHNLTTSADFWWYRIRDNIELPGDQEALNADHNVCRYGQACAGNQKGAPGTIYYFHNTLANVGKIHTNGVDLSANYLLPTSFGNWTFNGNFTRVFQYNTDNGDGFHSQLNRMDGFNDYSVQFKWKGSATIGWSKGPWNAGVTGHYMSGYADYPIASSHYPVHSHVSSMTTFDVYAGYKGPHGLQLTLGSTNVFNRKPAYTDYNLATTGIDTRYNDPLGRVVYLDAGYRF